MTNTVPMQRDLMAAVLELNRLVCSSLDLDEVLRRILHAAHDLSEAESVTVMLLDEAGEWLTVSAAIGTSRNVYQDVGLRMGEGLAGWVAQTGQPLHLSNPAADPRYHHWPSAPISNILALPLQVRDRILGVLNLSQYDSYALFSETVVQMMEVFASHAAIAIDNAETATKLRRAAARERLLNQINHAVRDMGNADAVIDLALRDLTSNLQGTSCTLYRRVTTGHTSEFHLTNEWRQPAAAVAPEWSDQSWMATADRSAAVCKLTAAGAWITAPISYRGRLLSWLRLFAQARTRCWRADELDLVQAVGDQLAIAIAQAELTQQEQRSRNLSESLGQLAAACNAMISQEVLLNFVLEQLARFVAYDSAAIWLSRDEDYVKLVASRGHQSDIHNLILYVGPGSLDWRRTGQRRAVVISDVQQDPRWQDVPDSQIICSWVGVPLWANKQFIGLLSIDQWQPDAFGENDRQIAEAFADHVAVAIHNARLYQQAQARTEQLQALHRLSIRLSAMHAVEPLLDELAHLLHTTFGYYQVNVALVEDGNLVIKAVAGQVHAVADLQDTGCLAGGAGLAEQAMRKVAAVLVNDLAREPDYVALPLLEATQAELVVPINGADRVLGVIDVHGASVGQFSQDDVYLLESLAGQTAVVLENIARYDELQRTQEELLRSERLRALGELSSGVAHDFNNLLAGILGHAQLLLLEPMDATIREGLRVIERAALDGAAMVRRLQDFAQTHHSPPDDIVAINSVIEESLAITRPRWRDAAQSCGISVEVVCELSAQTPVIGDAPVLRELVTNLILNALDAMPHGGELRIRTFEQDARPYSGSDPAGEKVTTPMVVIEVRDTGIGMPANIQKRIFDPFFTTKGARGTGMGLAVAHGIVQRHHGSITVRSAPGMGSTFTVTLPMQTATMPKSEPKEARQSVDLSALRVLIVEDELMVQRVLTQLFERWGCQVTAVASGAEALDLFQPYQFDLVCTDLGMPGMSGWELLEQIRQQDPDVATLLITGWGEQLDPEDARTRGADRVLVKPFDATALYRTISAMNVPARRLSQNELS